MRGNRAGGKLAYENLKAQAQHVTKPWENFSGRPVFFSGMYQGDPTMLPRSSSLYVALTAALLVGGCDFDVASFNGNCKRVKGTELRVAQDQTCKFRYDQGDMAKYVVQVTRQPTFGDAMGEGKYLKYVARKGFKGEDSLTIRIERRGIGHVQWETRRITVKVGPTA
jgi:hypothetical protein